MNRTRLVTCHHVLYGLLYLNALHHVCIWVQFR